MKRVSVLWFFCISLLFVMATSVAYGAVVTYFPSTDIADGNGIYASATASVTTGTGYVDITIQNTSPLGPLIDSEYANPFLVELEFTFPDGLSVDDVNSSVSSLAGSYFARGKDPNVALYSATSRTLNYDVIDRDDPKGLMKKCLMSHAEAGVNQNDNTAASINVLDGSYIPQEGHMVGFLNDNPDTYSGAVFDAVTYHIIFNQTDAEVPESFYTPADKLVVKYQGGGDYSLHVYNVPEPVTVALLGLGALAVLKRRKR